MAKLEVIGFDIGKEHFQVHGVDRVGAIVVRRKLRRSQVAEFFQLTEPCLVGLEAGGTSIYWARLLSSMGHTVKLMPAQYVKAYIKLNKNDANDAEAICEAVQRPSMRFVPIKSEVQQALQILHRARELLMRQRTMLINSLRGHLAEFGVIAPRGAAGAAMTLKSVDEISKASLPETARAALAIMVQQVRALSTAIDDCDERMRHWHENNALSQLLATTPGIGPLAATALFAAVGDGKGFHSGRELAAWIGLVPRQFSTGGKQTLGHITKRGNSYLRRLLYLGAQNVMISSKKGPLVAWIGRLRSRRPFRVAAIALANKLARIAWAVLTSGIAYQRAL